MAVTLLTVVLVITLSLLLYQTFKVTQLQKQYILAEEERVSVVTGNIKELEAEQQITLEYIQQKRKEFDRLEKELKKSSKESISINDAIKILEK